LIEIRRTVTWREEIHHEFGPPPAQPLIRGAVAALLANPYAGRYEPDILPMMAALNAVGLDMGRRLLTAMDVPPERIQSYGKGAIIGGAGELEHGALWHVPGGYAMRELLGWQEGAGSGVAGAAGRGNALAIVPSTKKVGAPGATLDVPLTHINASYVRGHFDAMSISVAGAPAADELLFILVMATGGRVHQRVGGLTADAISKWDGLR
jgi:hypothetical protein